MKSLWSLIAAAALALGLSYAPAQAASYSLPSGTSAFVTADGAGDTFSFSLSQTSNLAGVIFDQVFVPFVDAQNYTVSLFSGTPSGSNAFVTTLASTGTAAAFSYAALAAGTYYLKVLTTLASGALGASYVIGLSGVAATPIPGALLLFMSALGGLGFVGYRRRKLSA